MTLTCGLSLRGAVGIVIGSVSGARRNGGGRSNIGRGNGGDGGDGGDGGNGYNGGGGNGGNRGARGGLRG
ncbi:unnamed protein product [Cylindrotheca closterium]|uniref:Uncharacterized protein n=1 Tax=Cylindrotheca closterium TaxID=2856 RepID=A0AAD2FM85_9STRA|nr:unnamed protein product [Cylindrotheca closterium]